MLTQQHQSVSQPVSQSYNNRWPHSVRFYFYKLFAAKLTRQRQSTTGQFIVESRESRVLLSSSLQSDQSPTGGCISSGECHFSTLTKWVAMTSSAHKDLVNTSNHICHTYPHRVPAQVGSVSQYRRRFYIDRLIESLGCWPIEPRSRAIKIQIGKIIQATIWIFANFDLYVFACLCARSFVRQMFPQQNR